MHPVGKICHRRQTRQGILAMGDGVAVDLPEGCVFLGQLEAALAKGPDVHQSLNEGEEQCRCCIKVNVFADGAVPHPLRKEFLQAGDIFSYRLRRLFVQFSITEADNLGNDLKGDSFAQVDCGEMIPDDFLDDVECNRFSTRTLRRDVLDKGLFDMAEQEKEDTLLAREMAVDGRFGDADLRGDPLDCQMFAAVFEDQLRCGFDDLLLPEFRIFPLCDHRLSSWKRSAGPRSGYMAQKPP